MKLACPPRTRSSLLPGLLALSLLVAPAMAEFLVDTFVPLRAELELRRDTDFGGKLDKAAKQQQKAVLKSLKRLDKPADSMLDDLRSAGALAGYLAKPYAAEFGAESGIGLGVLFGDLATALTGLVQADLDALVVEAAGLTGKTQTKVLALAGKAQDKVDAAEALGSTFKKRFGQLVKAAKLIAKGHKLAGKGAGGGTKDTTTATVDGAPWTSSGNQCEVYSVDDALQLYASRSLPSGDSQAIYLLVGGVSGPGTYPLEGDMVVGNFQQLTPAFEFTKWDLVKGSGSLVVTTYDLVTPHIVASFAFSVDNDVLGGFTIANGQHDVQSEVYLYDAAGF